MEMTNRGAKVAGLIAGIVTALIVSACASAPPAPATAIETQTPIIARTSPPTETERSTATVTTPTTLTLLGADVSSLQRNLALGAKYFDENGVQADPLQILKDHGINAIRLRVWVNPPSGWNNKEKVTEFARQVKSMGFKLLIDFHYSDTWADPGKQFTPTAWIDHNVDELAEDVRAHTLDVCQSLIAADAAPDMVQIGNEINGGMLWPTGRAETWDRLEKLLKAGVGAVRECSPDTQVMLHVANAGDSSGARLWYTIAQKRGIEWDVTGLSYYSYWHGPMADMTATIADLKSRFDKPVVIVETSYAFTLEAGDSEPNIINADTPNLLTEGYPPTPEGQAANLRDVLSAARAGGAIGVFYWEPAWTAIAGNGWDPADPASGDQWENQALFDYSGKALPALGEFKP